MNNFDAFIERRIALKERQKRKILAEAEEKAYKITADIQFFEAATLEQIANAIVKNRNCQSCPLYHCGVSISWKKRECYERILEYFKEDVK